MLNEGVSDLRIGKLKFVYKAVKRHLGDYESATRESIEEFIYELNDNKITKLNGDNYSGITKSDFKKFLRQFYKWYEGENEFYPKKVSWIKSRIRKDELPKQKDIISMDECIRLSGSFRNIEHRMITLLLFDSGFRIGEMLSVKKKDLTFEQFDGEKKCFWIKCNNSKTTPRKVPINLFTEQVKELMKSTYYLAKADDDLLFDFRYETVRNTLSAKSKEVLGKKLSPHHFRHSSATYYAKTLNGNLFALCERYGWSFDSKEAKIYVRESGAYQIEGAKANYDDELSKMKQKLNRYEERMEKMQEALILLEELKKRMV